MAAAEGLRNGKFSWNGKLDHSCAKLTKSRIYDSRVRNHVVHLGLNVNSSTHNCGYVHVVDCICGGALEAI